MFTQGGGKPLYDRQLRQLLPESPDRGGAARLLLYSFRDWATEETDHPREVAEAALAHKVRNQIEAAYRRSDLFERRRRLMNDWAAYVAGASDVQRVPQVARDRIPRG